MIATLRSSASSNLVNRPIVRLYSASPRRKEILESAGYPVELAALACKEPDPKDWPGTRGEEFALLCSQCKMDAASAQPDFALAPNEWALCGDTIVATSSRILGKPHNQQQAIQMYQALSGTTHTVFSATTIRYAEPGSPQEGQHRTVHVIDGATVEFDRLDDQAIEQLLADDYRSFAGGYAIQGAAGAFCRIIEGSFETVMGLPIQAIETQMARVYQ